MEVAALLLDRRKPLNVAPEAEHPDSIDSTDSTDYVAVMAVLTIRNLPDEVRTRLRVRASRNGRSMEAEARAILTGAVNAPAPEDLPKAIADLQSWIAKAGGKRAKAAESHKVDAFIRERRRNAIREAIDDGYHPRNLFKGDYPRILSEAGWTQEYVQHLLKQSPSK
jgi:plasmid stability protein